MGTSEQKVSAQKTGVPALLAGGFVGAAFALIYMIIRPLSGFFHENADVVYLLGLLGICAGSIFAGIMLDKKAVLKTMICAAVLGAFMALGGVFTSNIALLTACTTISSVGAGMALVSALYTVQRWMPTRKGLACGIVFGSSALILWLGYPVIRTAILKNGVSVMFTVLGLAAAVIWAVCGIFMKIPDDGYTQRVCDPKKVRIQPSSVQFTVTQMLRGKHFRQLILMVIASVAFVSMVLQKMDLFIEARQLTAAELESFVANTALAALLGCIIMGSLSDWLRRKLTFMILFAVMGVGGWIAHSFIGSMFLTGVSTVLFTFGGAIACLPAVITDFYGEKHAGKNLSVLIASGAVISALLYLLSGFFVKQPGGMIFPFEFVIIVAVVGLVMAISLGRPSVEIKAADKAEEDIDETEEEE